MSARHPLLDPDARLVIAHRGNRIAAPENTLLAIAQAVDLGADAVEIDVRATRDGTPVLMHDPTLDRTTTGHGAVNLYTMDEIRTLRARAVGGATTDEHVPALAEVLERFPRTPLIIEVKEFAAAAATALLVERFAAADRVLVGSLDPHVCEWFYRSPLRTCASVADAARLLPRALVRRPPAARRYDVLSITPRFHGFPVPIVAMAQAARRGGLPTHVWTVNDASTARRLWDAGVAGIVTDDPGALVRARSR